MHQVLRMQRLSQYGASVIQHSSSSIITARLDAQNQPGVRSSETACVSALQQNQSLPEEHLPAPVLSHL